MRNLLDSPATKRQGIVQLREAARRAQEVIETVMRLADAQRNVTLSDNPENPPGVPLGIDRKTETRAKSGSTPPNPSVPELNPKLVPEPQDDISPLTSPTLYNPADFMHKRGAARIDRWKAIGAGTVVQDWLTHGVRVS